MTEFLDEISSIVGAKGLLVGDDVRQRPEDWLGRGACQALAIVRPVSTAEVSAVLRACNKARQPIVPLGGMTGLVHGADAGPNEIMLSLERMRAIEEIDPIGRTLITQAGAVLQTVQEAATEERLQFALDLGARGACTIGGNIATNAGGNQVVRYGMMREQVLGLEAVLADGTIMSSMNTSLKNNAGYDLKQLFIGSEGTLGIVTRAVLRLHPKLVSKNTSLIGVSSFEALIGLFSLVGEQLAGALTAFEVMWQDYYRLIAVDSGRHTAPLSGDHAYYVIIEVQGSHADEDAEQFARALSLATDRGLINDAVIAQSEAQSQAIWNIREDIAGLAGALMPLCTFDVSLPIRTMENYVGNLRLAVRNRWGDTAKIIVFGHLGDGNLHIIVSVGDDSEDTQREMEQLVYAPLQEIGGSISAEHGIGLEKRNYLGVSRSPAEIDLMRKLKKSLDPNNILNPHKIFV